MKNKKVLISGANGHLVQEIVKNNNTFEIIAVAKNKMNVCCIEQIKEQILLHEPDIFFHCAALTHPMEYHTKNPGDSIKNNIIGTANVASLCISENIKMVYVSTDWVYPDKKYNTEEDAMLPSTNYGWSKLGGECAVHMVPNHLVLRCSFTSRPYKFDRAFIDVYKSYLYIDEASQQMLELIKKDCSGIYNICGETRTVYSFAKESNSNVGKIKREEIGAWYPRECTMSNNKTMRVIDGATAPE